MLPCLLDRRRVAPLDEDSYMDPLQENDECTEVRDVSQLPQLTTNPDDYDIFQSIGVGCFGAATILIAQHKPQQMFTVLRLVDLEMLSVKQLDEVQNEMRLSNLFQHQNIAGYFCSFVVGPKLWAVQELMHYGSCADIMHSAEPFKNGFKENVIAVILRDVVRGLNYLHNLGYVHRSIKAKHFLIHEDGMVKLSGIRNAVSMIESGSKMKALHGHFSNTVDNICWLAPEVLAQDLSGYTVKSDVYSVGIAALELATGEAPFAGLPVTEIMMLKLRGHPPVLMRRQEGEEPTRFSSIFSKVVDICVHPNPSCRPTPSKMLSSSFLKLRKKSVGVPSLKELLLPVVPLDTSKLNADDALKVSAGVTSGMRGLTVQDSWAV